ncbi:MAG: hypothetical protein IKK48_03685 [Firmicutes bacterium]|nr:hypothetical protein [Bacillota bacterium]
MRKIMMMIALLAAILTACTTPSYQADGIEEYDIPTIVDEYVGDLDSSLAIFPDAETVAAAKAEYTAFLYTGLFDTDGEIVLECTYDKGSFEQENQRLAGLSMTIVSGEENHVNTVLYDADSYNYPAYITADGFGHTYEYALMDEENLRIIYVYLSYPDEETGVDVRYLKRDAAVYEKADTFDRFSMYNHSFDGGESWTEFSD